MQKELFGYKKIDRNCLKDWGSIKKEGGIVNYFCENKIPTTCKFFIIILNKDFHMTKKVRPQIGAALPLHGICFMQ